VILSIKALADKAQALASQAATEPRLCLLDDSHMKVGGRYDKPPLSKGSVASGDFSTGYTL
jgi:hypothetical protein